MNYAFRPDTHWHSITHEAHECLLRAGYSEDRLCMYAGEEDAPFNLKEKP